MKIIRLPKIFLFLLSLAAFAYSQVPADGFVCGKGRFALAIESKPTKREDVHYTLGKYELNGESIAWDTPGYFVDVEYFEVYGDKDNLTSKDKAAVIGEYKKSFLEGLKKVGILAGEAPYSFDGFPGLEIKGITNSRVVSHLFFTKTRFVVVSITNYRTDGFEPLLKILDSFRYLTKPQYAAALISENTPAPLPQTSGLKNPQSDAKENDLKGKVRSVSTDSQESAKSTRERESEENYDENGNLMKEIYFHFGYPSIIKQWGWIDGARVSDEKFIEYGSNEGPNENGITELVQMVSPEDEKEKAKKRDDRFSNRYEYKYDSSGRLIEKIMYQNDGLLWTREMRTYTPRKRENAIYDEKGKLNSKSVEIIDEAGNIIEERNYDFHDKLEGIKSYKYEFDPSGNWVVRRDFDKSTVNGKVVLKPSSISYRIITYY